MPRWLAFCDTERHARPHRHRTRAQGQAVGGLQPRLAGVEPRREDRRARPGDARVLSGALSADRGPRRDGARVRRRRAARDRGGQGRHRARPTSGASPSRRRRPSRNRWARRSSSAGSRCLRACWAFFDGVAARVSPEMRKGPRGGGRDRDRIIRHTIRVESEDFAKRVGLRIPEEGGADPGRTAAVSGGLRRGDARVQRRRGREARCGRGRCRSSSGTPPSTRSTTRGRWRTRTSPPRAPDPTTARPPIRQRGVVGTAYRIRTGDLRLERAVS